MNFIEGVYWYTSNLINSAAFTFLLVFLAFVAIIYYPKYKFLAIRWGCLPRSASYEISV